MVRVQAEVLQKGNMPEGWKCGNVDPDDPNQIVK